MEKLVDADGQARFGIFDEPVHEINFRDFDWRSPMDRKRRRWRRYWGFNQFQFISVQGPDWLAAAAVVDLKLVGNCFFYLFDFGRGRIWERSLLQPLARHTGIQARPDDGYCRFARGNTRVTLDADGRGRQVSVRGGDRIAFELAIEQPDDYQPLRLCSPAGYNGWVYTQKWAGLPVSGEVRWGEERWRTTDLHRASVDWSCGFMRRETAWNWACLAGCLESGVTVGLNLAVGVNESGMTENALWWNGKLIKLASAQFQFQRYRPDRPWRLTTSDGRVDLIFEPAGTRAEKINALLIASNFRQYCGTFNGRLRGPDGQWHAVSGLRGLVEDHYARW